jgi:negative regulator of sigma E activity
MKIKSSLIGAAVLLIAVLIVSLLTGCKEVQSKPTNGVPNTIQVYNQKMTQVEMGTTGYYIVTRPWKPTDEAETYTMQGRWGERYLIVESQTPDKQPRVVWP